MQQVEEALILLEGQKAFADYAGIIETGQKLLNDIPQWAAEYIEVLGDIGLAHARLQHYPQAYEAFTKALSLEPDNPYVLLNLGIVEGFTDRLGQSVRHLERAVALLDKSDPRARDAQKALQRSIKDAQKAMKKRGPNFTLDQLIEQETFYLQSKELMAAQKWEEAEQVLQRSIALGDCYAQPWGNLGYCLIKQQRYDEAEAALKRALIIDEHYPPAQMNLQALEKLRRGEH
ncbi:MAG: tetratricopeptide repeat protein, partial [Ktedonobacteraceae bacterium]